jgi:hypothetical protein
MRNLFLIFTLLFISEAAFSETYRRLVNFEWETIENAKLYELEIRQINKKDAKTFNFKIKEAAWNGRLPAGKYKMKLRALDSRGVPGEWGDPIDFDVNLENVSLKAPLPNANIVSKEEKNEEITLEWNPVGGADSYVVEVHAEDGKLDKSDETEKTSYTVKLPVATRFTWKVSAKNKAGMASDAISVSQFSLLGSKLEKPKIDKPESDFVREMKWNKPDFTDRFDLAVSRFNRQTKKWEVVKSVKDGTDPSIAIDEKWPGGDYKIAVRAKGNLRQNSEVISETFKVRSGLRSPAAEYTALMRKSIDRVSGWYGIASYLITEINFSSTSQETQTGLNYKAIGGTGRLGLGWFSDVSPWGFLSILDLSGFTYNDSNVTYASLETSAVWRKTIGERGELRSQFGLYYKELPGTVGNALAGTTTNQNIATAGPHAGVEYWHSITPKLGLQVNAHLYISALTLKTPSGGAVDPTLSTQFGFLGSWRLSNRFTGLAGYARRDDKIKYKPGPAVGNISQSSVSGNNEVNVQGDFLNFFAEYAF